MYGRSGLPTACGANDVVTSAPVVTKDGSSAVTITGAPAPQTFCSDGGACGTEGSPIRNQAVFGAERLKQGRPGFGVVLPGATLSLTDYDAPMLVSSTNSHPRWVRSAHGEITVTTTDTGLGMKGVSVSHATLGTTPTDDTHTHPCLGDRRDRCPADWNTSSPSWTITNPHDTDAMPEGVQPHGLVLRDIVGNRTPQAGEDTTSTPPSKIDRSAPDPVEGTGELPGLDDRWIRGDDTRTLTATAHDRYSGVATLTVETEGGTVLDRADVTCADDQCPNDASRDLRVDTTQLPEGVTMVRVRATDLVGNTATSASWRIKIDRTVPATVVGSGQIPEAHDTWIRGDDRRSVTADVTDLHSGPHVIALETAASQLLDEITIDCSPQGCPTAAQRSLNVDTSTLPEGITTVRLRATDQVGRSAESRSWTIKVDRSAPAVPTELDGFYDSEQASSGSVDTGWVSGVDPRLSDGSEPSGTVRDEIRWARGGQPATPWLDVHREENFSIPNVADGGFLHVEVRSTDRAGNVSASAQTDVELRDETVPESSAPRRCGASDCLTQTLVTVDPDASLRTVSERLEQAEPELTVVDDLARVGVLEVDLNGASVTELRALPGVKAVETAPLPSLTDFVASRDFGVNVARRDFGVTGDGSGDPVVQDPAEPTIAILDSGVDRNHDDLRGKVVAANDLFDGTCNTAAVVVAGCGDVRWNAGVDGDDHGTHVAAIAAGSGATGVRFRGVASGAPIVDGRVCGPVDVDDAPGDQLEIRCGGLIRGMEWVLAVRAAFDAGAPGGVNIRVVNMSIGGPPCEAGTDGCDTPGVNEAFNRAAQRLADAGILPVISAGNNGPQLGVFDGASWPLYDAIHRPGLGHLASMPAALTVGAASDTSRPGGIRVAPFSSRGPAINAAVSGRKPEVLAPGTNIAAASAGTSRGHEAKSGTSMAAPYAAGVAMLAIDAQPAVTVAQLRERFTRTAEDWGRPGHDGDYGFGMINPRAIVDPAQPAVFGSPWQGSRRHLGAVGRIANDDDVDAYEIQTRVGMRFALTVLDDAPHGHANGRFLVRLYNGTERTGDRCSGGRVSNEIQSGGLLTAEQDAVVTRQGQRTGRQSAFSKTAAGDGGYCVEIAGINLPANAGYAYDLSYVG